MNTKPRINTSIGRMFLCFGYEVLKDQIPINSDKLIIPNSTQLCARKFNPQSGRVVIKKGRAAQCMAQTIAAVIPKWSNLFDLKIGFIICGIKIICISSVNINAIMLRL